MSERDDMIEALRLTAENYGPCDVCKAPVADLWRWRNSKDGDPSEDILDHFCSACAIATGQVDECVHAEPVDAISAFAKVRHLIVVAEPSSKGFV